MQEHQRRVLEQKKELDIKLEALNKFMMSDTFPVLCDEDEQMRLIDQCNAMTFYSQVLGKRIAAFK